MAPELATRRLDVLWDFARSKEGEGLIAGDTGQHIIRGIVEDQMSYIAWDNNGVPNELTLRHRGPSKVIVNVDQSFGQPIFAGTRTRVADLAGMMKAGEDAEIVAEEFGLPISDVRTAARILPDRAA